MLGILSFWRWYTLHAGCVLFLLQVQQLASYWRWGELGSGGSLTLCCLWLACSSLLTTATGCPISDNSACGFGQLCDNSQCSGPLVTDTGCPISDNTASSMVNWVPVTAGDAQALLWEKPVPYFWQQCRWLGQLGQQSMLRPPCESNWYPIIFWQQCQWLGQLGQQSVLRPPCENSWVPCFWPGDWVTKCSWQQSVFRPAPDSSQCSNLLLTAVSVQTCSWQQSVFKPAPDSSQCSNLPLTAVSVQTCSWQQSVFKPAPDSSQCSNLLLTAVSVQTCSWQQLGA